jgi:hypothetical protein
VRFQAKALLHFPNKAGSDDAFGAVSHRGNIAICRALNLPSVLVERLCIRSLIQNSLPDPVTEAVTMNRDIQKHAWHPLN